MPSPWMLALVGVAVAGSAAAQTPPPRRLAPADVPPATVTGSIDMARSLPQIGNYEMRQMLFTVPPGTGRAWHSHAVNPEIARVLSGVLTDVRNDGAPTEYGPGSTLINSTEVEHAWANLGREPVVLLATVLAPKPSR